VTIDTASGPPCSGFTNCDFENADANNRPVGWVGKLKPGDVLTTSPVQHGSKAFQFSGKSGARTLYQDVMIAGNQGDTVNLSFYVDGSGLGGGDSAKVSVVFYNGNKKKNGPTITVTPAMNFTAQQTAAIVAPSNFTKIRVTLTATLKTVASKVVFDVFSIALAP
jgi:hypothetical protein